MRLRYHPAKTKAALDHFQPFLDTRKEFYCAAEPETGIDPYHTNAPEDTNANHVDPYLATRPERYRDVVLPSNLSEYLPDDQEAALALVGNNYDNILHGEELEKAFDSD